MNVYVKRLSSLQIEAWVEVFNASTNQFDVVAECKVIDAGDLLLVDEIYTKIEYRRMGYASVLIQKLLTIKKVMPAGIVNTEAARSFWSKLNMEDALSTPIKDLAQRCLLDAPEYNHRIKEIA